MTAMDSPRYEAAYAELCACYRQRLTPEHLAQRDAWWRKLAAYDIERVVRAFEAAPRHAKSYFPNLGNIYAALEEQDADKGGIRDTGSPTRYYQDEAGVTQAEYRCWLCCDLGWRAKVRATGELLTEADLQARVVADKDDPRRLSTADYTMTRCECRMRGAMMRGAA